MTDQLKYGSIPFKSNGRSRDGADCAGLSIIFLEEEFSYKFLPDVPADRDGKDYLARRFIKDSYQEKERGDLVFFTHPSRRNKICHVAIFLGDGKYMHMSRRGVDIVNGLTLIRRQNYLWAGAISVNDVAGVCAALQDPSVKDFGISETILLVVSLALTLAGTLLSVLGTSQMGSMRNQEGRYSFDALVTKSDPEIPLADILGKVTTAGNSPYTTPQDKSLTVTDSTVQKANKVVVRCSGPIEGYDLAGYNLKINGLQWDNKEFRDTNGQDGFRLNPQQTKAEAVTGTIDGNTNVPSISIYTGAHDISVPVDIRASYDRNFPVYGFSGCAYEVYRLIDSTKFQNFNTTATIFGRQCRSFDEDGFIRANDTATFTGDGVTTRFKLANWDVDSVTDIEINAGTVNLISPADQGPSKHVYWLNKTKGYIEFTAAPDPGDSIYVEYTYFPRTWTNNPANLIVYLLTENRRGKGIFESKIDWPRAVEARDYWLTNLDWLNDDGVTTGPRATANYILDSFNSLQQHLQAILDAGYGYLFLSAGKFVIKARKADTSVKSFTADTIVAGSFTAEMIDRRNVANEVQTFFHPDLTYNSEDSVKAEDPFDQEDRADQVGNEGVVNMQLKTPAIDNVPQAQRLALTIVREQVACEWAVTFTTNILAVGMEPGDVIDVTHPVMPNWNQKLLRVEKTEYDEKRRLVLTCSDFSPACYI